jgi:hypothetical protein
MSDQTLLFLHIPKTAGTTLNSIIERQYAPPQIYALGEEVQKSLDSYRRMPTAEKQQHRLVTGHMGFGLHEDVPGPSRYFTVLRQPLERCVSFYYFVQRLSNHYLHEHVYDQSWSLAQFVESGVTIMMDNFQTRLLSGAWDKPAMELFQFAQTLFARQVAAQGISFEWELARFRLQQRWHSLRRFSVRTYLTKKLSWENGLL